MATRIRVTVDGAGAYRDALNDLAPKNSAWLSRALRKGAFLIQRIAAEEKIERGGSHAPLPDRLTSRTGTLRRSIGVDLGPLPRAAEVGTELVYGLVHELGLGPYPERPFLGPAVDDAIEPLGGLFADEWQAELP